jgi:hypothetical protein
MIEKTKNKYAGNASAAGSPVQNRLDVKPSHIGGVLCTICLKILYKIMLSGFATSWQKNELTIL